LVIVGADAFVAAEGNSCILNDLECSPTGVEEPGMLIRKPWELGRSVSSLGLKPLWASG